MQIKPVQVIWDRADYILEAEKHLNGKYVYKEVKFNENILTGLVEKSKKIFNSLCSHMLISERASTILPAILRKQPTWEALLFT